MRKKDLGAHLQLSRAYSPLDNTEAKPIFFQNSCSNCLRQLRNKAAGKHRQAHGSPQAGIRDVQQGSAVGWRFARPFAHSCTTGQPACRQQVTDCVNPSHVQIYILSPDAPDPAFGLRAGRGQHCCSLICREPCMRGWA